jgi:predicted methyltransferase
MADIIPNAPELAGKLPKPVFADPNHHIKIYQGDCLETLAAIPADCVDLTFADPPLSACGRIYMLFRSSVVW